jgi:hypothetical protein
MTDAGGELYRYAIVMLQEAERAENASPTDRTSRHYTWHLAAIADLTNVRFALPAQPVDATQALNLSAGVSNCKVSRGRSLS